MFRHLLGACLLAVVVLAVYPASADCCCCGDVWIHIDYDFWGWDDCCCCCECWYVDWWELPYWLWPPCCRRIIRIYYSPCGWYRYIYYDYPCAGCTYVCVEGRWVWRRAVRLERKYSYSDMARDFVRRRGMGYVVRHKSSSTTERVYRSSSSHGETYRYKSSSSPEVKTLTKRSKSTASVRSVARSSKYSSGARYRPKSSSSRFRSKARSSSPSYKAGRSRRK